MEIKASVFKKMRLCVEEAQITNVQFKMIYFVCPLEFKMIALYYWKMQNKCGGKWGAAFLL